MKLKMSALKEIVGCPSQKSSPNTGMNAKLREPEISDTRDLNSNPVKEQALQRADVQYGVIGEFLKNFNFSFPVVV